MPAAVSSVVSYGVGGAMLAVAWLEWTQNRCTHPRRAARAGCRPALRVGASRAEQQQTRGTLRAAGAARAAGICAGRGERSGAKNEGARRPHRLPARARARARIRRARDPRQTIYRACLKLSLPRLAMVGSRRHGAPITLAAARQEQAGERRDRDCRACVEARRHDLSPAPVRFSRRRAQWLSVFSTRWREIAPTSRSDHAGGARVRSEWVTRLALSVPPRSW